MQYYLFGYGSILNPSSLKKTIPRSIQKKEIFVTNLNGFIRKWNTVASVKVGNDTKIKHAVFLDIIKKKNSITNGILIPVSQSDIEKMDLRERQYKRIDVSDNLSLNIPDSCSYTYTSRSRFQVKNYKKPCVLTEYEKIVQNGAQYWGVSFVQVFSESTEPHSFARLDGSYKFADKRQNLLTGH